jgi:hypothetical protein
MTPPAKGIIGSVLSPACRVWLKSQMSAVSELDINISGRDRQILGGTIPQVSARAVGAIYRGLVLGKIEIVAEQIQVNLPQVIRGKPLQLLEPIAVSALAQFSEADLQSSLAAPLLDRAITDLLGQILNANPQQAGWEISWEKIEIFPDRLALNGTLTQQNRSGAIAIATGISISNGCILHLSPLQISSTIDLPGSNLTSHSIDLGDGVNITRLILDRGELICEGQIQVRP